MKLCLLFHSDLVPRWLKTYYFLSLDGAEFDGRWVDRIPSLHSLINHIYISPWLWPIALTLTKQISPA